MLTVEEILKRPLFRSAELVAGRNGKRRYVGWVHILDVKNASLYINRDDLILTTGMGIAGAQQEEREQYMKELIHSGAAGLCVELGDYVQGFPKDMIALADQHDFPLIVFTECVRFVDITQDIHSLLVNHQLDALKQLTSFSQELQRLTVQGTGIKPLLSALHRYTLQQVVYYYPSGESLFVPTVSNQAAQNMLRSYQTALEANTSSTEQALVFQLNEQQLILSHPVIVMGQKTAYVGLFINGMKVSDPLLMSLDYTSKSITNFLLRRSFLEEKKLESQNQFIDEILAGKVINESQALERIGLSVSSTETRFFVAGIAKVMWNAFRYEREDFEFVQQDIILLFRSLFSKQGLETLLMARGKQIYVVCIAKGKISLPVLKKRLSAFVVDLKKSLSYLFQEEVAISIGFGEPKTRLTEIQEGFQEAEETLQINQRLPQPLSCFYEDMGVYQLSVKLSNPDFLHAFVRRHIGALLDYDREHNARLVETLRTYLRTMGSKQQASHDLFIHRQTLYHRLEKCEELLGEEYMEPEKRLCIEIAMQFYELLR